MRILHIADLHLRRALPGRPAIPTRLGRETPGLLARAVQAALPLQPDLAVLAGDLLDYPFDAFDDPKTLDLGEQDLRLIAGILKPLPCPLAIVPGNHEPVPLFLRVFGHLPVDFNVQGRRVLCFHDQEGPGHLPQRTGRQLDQFRNALASPDPAPQIHVQHYLLWPERNQGYPHTYPAAPELIDAIARSGRQILCLSGHYHLGHPPEQAQGVWFAAAPAFCEAPHPFWVYDLTPSGPALTVHTLA